MMASGSDTSEARLEWSDLRQHVVHRAGRGLRLAGATLALGVLICAIAPVTYRSDAVLAVLPAPEYTVREPAGTRESTNAALALAQMMSAETALLASRDVAAQTIRDIGIRTAYPELSAPKSGIGTMLRLWFAADATAGSSPIDAAADTLLRRLRIVPARDSNVISISLRDSRPAMAPILLSALLNAYSRHRQIVYNDPQLDIVEHELKHAERAAADAANRLAAFRQDRALIDVATERNLLLRQRDSLTTSLMESDARAAGLRKRIVTLQRQTKELPRSATLYADYDDAALTKQDDRLMDLRDRLAAVSTHYKDSSSAVRRLRLEIATLLRQRTALRSDPAAKTERIGPPPEHETIAIDITRSQADIADAEGHSASIRRSLWITAQSLKQLEASEVEEQTLLHGQQSADTALAAAQRVFAERRMTEAAEQIRTARVRVLQTPSLPRAAMPLRLMISVFFIALSCVAFLIYTVGDYILNPVFYSVDTVTTASLLPVLAVFAPSQSRTEAMAVSREH